MKRKLQILALVAAASIVIAGCASQQAPAPVIEDDAPVRALADDRVGTYMDDQQSELERAMQPEREGRQLEIERLGDDTLRLTVDSEVAFDFAKAEIRPTFRPSLDKLAPLIVKYRYTVVHVVGHTDSIGSDGYNQTLSERRAQSVVDYLGSYGVPRERLRPEGRGEREPRADNTTAAGRQLNRRVEIFLVPIVAGREPRAYDPPSYD
jgi:outer membrane protein OmpA-like peptidoglycan-associated protein